MLTTCPPARGITFTGTKGNLRGPVGFLILGNRNREAGPRAGGSVQRGSVIGTAIVQLGRPPVSISEFTLPNQLIWTLGFIGITET